MDAKKNKKKMIIMVRDGMGWFTRWGLILYLSVDYGWSVNKKMVVAISNLSYVVSGSLLALIPNFIQIGQKNTEVKKGWLSVDFSQSKNSCIHFKLLLFGF